MTVEKNSDSGAIIGEFRGSKPTDSKNFGKEKAGENGKNFCKFFSKSFSKFLLKT